jgi:hypothetical protein
MADRENYKVTKLRADRVWIGTGLGTEITDEIFRNSETYKRTHCLFEDVPFSIKKDNTAVGTGATGDENILHIGGVQFEQHILGTQTILVPVLSTGGLNIGLDQTDNDGMELCTGIVAQNRGTFVVGTDGAFFAKMKFSIATVAGTDDCAFGFRKMEAYQANIDDYDEMAALNVISGDIKIETILNNAATTTTDTTDNWADAETHTLEVYVSAAGVVTYKIDGAAPTVTAAFTFDDAEVVVPFFYFLHANAAQAGEIVLQEFECGIQDNI